MSSNELYVYTTASVAHKNYLKIGMTQSGRHRIRIAEQFGTANPEPPIIRWVTPLPDGVSDHKIHLQLEKNGINRAPESIGREWFVATTKFR